MKQGEPLVSIRCLVYNHEPFLRECLDGFIMQKTNFAFEAIVHDDASTDKSAAIIREYAGKYPDIIKPIYETENQYSKRDGSLSRIMNAAIHPAVKFIAMCEGDDYWTDPYKLQKQVDFLEQNEEFTLCSHRYSIFNQVSQEFKTDYLTGLFASRPAIQSGIVFEQKEYIDYPYMQTMTVVFNRNKCDFDLYMRLKSKGDLALFYCCLQNGKGFCMNENMAVYRISEAGVYSLKPVREKHKIGFRLYYNMFYDTHDDLFLKHVYSHEELMFGDYKQAILSGDRGWKYDYKRTMLFLCERKRFKLLVMRLLKPIYWKIKYLHK